MTKNLFNSLLLGLGYLKSMILILKEEYSNALNLQIKSIQVLVNDAFAN